MNNNHVGLWVCVGIVAIIVGWVVWRALSPVPGTLDYTPSTDATSTQVVEQPATNTLPSGGKG